jgi:hypothetical protein
MARPEPTITASRPTIIKIFPLFFVRVLFYLPEYRVSGTAIH